MANEAANNVKTAEKTADRTAVESRIQSHFGDVQGYVEKGDKRKKNILNFSEGDIFMQLNIQSVRDPQTGVWGPFQPAVMCSIANTFVDLGYDADQTEHFAQFLLKYAKATKGIKIPRRSNVKDDVEYAMDELKMTYSYPTMEDASASASEKFAASNVSKVVLLKDGSKLKVWS